MFGGITTNGGAGQPRLLCMFNRDLVESDSLGSKRSHRHPSAADGEDPRGAKRETHGREPWPNGFGREAN